MCVSSEKPSFVAETDCQCYQKIAAFSSAYRVVKAQIAGKKKGLQT